MNIDINEIVGNPASYIGVILFFWGLIIFLATYEIHLPGQKPKEESEAPAENKPAANPEKTDPKKRDQRRVGIGMMLFGLILLFVFTSAFGGPYFPPQTPTPTSAPSEPPTATPTVTPTPLPPPPTLSPTPTPSATSTPTVTPTHTSEPPPVTTEPPTVTTELPPVTTEAPTLTSTATQIPPGTLPETPPSMKVNDTYDMNVRSGPGIQYNTVGLLSKGDIVEIVGYSVNPNRPSEKWWFIKCPAIVHSPTIYGCWVIAVEDYSITNDISTLPIIGGPPPTQTPTPTPTSTLPPVGY